VLNKHFVGDGGARQNLVTVQVSDGPSILDDIRLRLGPILGRWQAIGLGRSCRPLPWVIACG
jgi:hypothetical protein